MTDPTPTTPEPQPATPKRRRWPWILAVVAALVLGFGIGAAAPADEQPASGAAEPAKQSGALDRTPALQQEVNELTADVGALTTERDELQGVADTQAARIAELEEQIAAAVAETAAEEAEQEAGTYTAGDYTFADVQVREDGLGDFEVRARVTNGGSGVEYASWTATIFSGDSVVGTAMGIVESIGTDETVTVTFISTDDYGDWDSVEFQVDSEF